MRITATYRPGPTGRGYILRLAGRLEGNGVEELGRSWQPLSSTIARIPIRVELSDLECVDSAGVALLAEMRLAGVEMIAYRTMRDSDALGA